MTVIDLLLVDDSFTGATLNFPMGPECAQPDRPESVQNKITLHKIDGDMYRIIQHRMNLDQ